MPKIKKSKIKKPKKCWPWAHVWRRNYDREEFLNNGLAFAGGKIRVYRCDKCPYELRRLSGDIF